MAHETLLKCRFSDSGRGFGFATVIEGNEVGCEDIYIAPEDTRGAMTDDTVLVHRFRHGESGYTRGNEGEVTKILERGNTEIIGTFTMHGALGTVRPDNEKIHALVHVSGADIGEARTGDKVAVKIDSFPKRRRTDEVYVLSGYITAVFGKAETREANYAAILHRHGIPTEFSDTVIWEAEDSAARKIEMAGRTDYRALSTLTIDGADAKDLDDAISLEKTTDGWHLYVHIADVSHYVPEGGEVDREAYRRGTSVYFVDKVVPMLPVALSNGACSLNGGEDRYALTAIITMDSAGNPTGYDFKKSVIRSDVRGVYSEVNDLLANGQSSPFAKKYGAVLPMLTEMHTLYDLLKEAADKRGQLALESTEAKFILDEKGIPTDIMPRTRGIGEMMIEQFMLAANVAAATFLTGRGQPCIYRVHPDPMPEKMRSFAVFAHNMGLNATGIGEGTKPQRLSEILAEAQENKIAEAVSGVMLRALSKAKYSEKPGAHYGLALPLYAHFTSPIRRYPDLFVHRAITAVLCGTRRPVHPAESARVSTETELRAVAAERGIEDLYMAQYASFHIGKEYTAQITSVCSFGVFARTDKLFEGLIPLESLFGRGARPDFNEDAHTLSCRVGGEMRVYRLGDTLTVRVEKADTAAGQIDFTLAGESTLPARESSCIRPNPSRGGSASHKGNASTRPRGKNGKGGKSDRGYGKNARFGDKRAAGGRKPNGGHDKRKSGKDSNGHRSR